MSDDPLGLCPEPTISYRAAVIVFVVTVSLALGIPVFGGAIGWW